MIPHIQHTFGGILNNEKFVCVNTNDVKKEKVLYARVCIKQLI